MKRISVYCGSSQGTGEKYVNAARELGQVLLEENLGLVYGGGRLGLMGAIARTVHEGGGEVIGIIPEALYQREVAYTDIADLRIVASMHERKAQIFDISDGFIALPGGLGTIEEIFEVLTWTQLGIHNKPCGFLNVGGYFESIIKFLDQALDKKFIDKTIRSMILIDYKADSLIDKFKNYSPPKIDKAKWALKLNNI